ncbi:MAG: sigma factor [Vicinamibacterales bacterium]
MDTHTHSTTTQAAPDWDALSSALARAVRRQCPPWLAADADDIAQQALSKVMRSDKVGEGKPPLAPFYLYRAAHSALVDEIRRRRRRREVALDGVADDDRPAVPEPAHTHTPESAASLRELGAAIRACLGGLSHDRRLAVALHLQGHTVPESARLLGWIVKRTENLVYRGMADLRACLLAKGHTP